MRILSTLGFMVVSVFPAFGSIIYFSPSVTVLPSAPASVSASVSDTTVYAFLEQQNVTLTSPVNVGVTMPGTWVCCSGLPTGTIPIGTTLDSYLMYAAPITNVAGEDGRDFQGSITFGNGEKIVAVILGFSNIIGTNDIFGAPGTAYPPSTCADCGEENDDSVTLSSNMESVYINFRVGAGNIDMVRVLTATPEPAEFALFGSGLVALGLIKRFRRS
ncbi:MAG TPA: hypothetical protein VMU80_19990 [Bryobacteraceae bacterium]|nr:hypothetical protein [Bryobacteraceae bacterium]